MTTVLHVLPHPGGGAETYIDVLAAIPGTRHERIALSSGRTPLQALRSLPRRYPAVARAARRFDVVHVHGDTAAMLSVPVLRGRPAVVATQGLHLVRRAGGPRAAVVRRGLRAVVRHADVTICTSQAERAEVEAIVGPALAARLATVPSGIALPPLADPAQRAATRAQLGLGDGDVAVLHLGQLEQRKRPLVAIAAARRAIAGGAPIVLLVAGDGPQLEQARAHAGERVRVLGFRSDAPQLLAAADVFVSLATREGLSFAVLEAMGRGLAMLVSDGPGNPEAVAGGAGIVVAVDDVAAAAAELARLAADADLRRRLGGAARERVRTVYNEALMVDGVGAAYARALAAYRA